MKRIVVAFSLLALPLAAQHQKQISLVAPTLPGRIRVPPAGPWQLTRINLYDDGVRPVLTFQNPESRMTLSVILFPNNTGDPTAEACRKDVLTPILKDLEYSAIVNSKSFGTHRTPSGTSLATASYLIANMSKAKDLPINQENVFAFIGNARTCAEIHLSKDDYKFSDRHLFNVALDDFAFDADYQPTSKDYTVLASIYFRDAQQYPAAAIYYQRALDSLPVAPPPDPATRRFLTDQLSMSYGIAGDIKRSRAVNEHAIESDPDYPLYYYNLACADAEQGHAADARTHLQQAFERKGNTLPGEHLPDPATDDSIMKLKNNKDFWAFVQTLSPQAKP